jgi:putative glutamine amidotransferase
MTPPLIGITTYERDEKDDLVLPALYVDAVRRAQGMAVLLPPGEPFLADLLARLDGLILSGGSDVDPAHYGGIPRITLASFLAERDTSEIELVRHAVSEGVPTLGICRGSQVLNVALGGTLIEHLPDVVGESTIHRTPLGDPVTHLVTVQPGSRLAAVLGKEQTEPASRHHQAAWQVAPGLAQAALAPDGTIEAVEMPGHPWFIGVQWHPELSASDDPTQQRLFDALVEAAAAYQRPKAQG